MLHADGGEENDASFTLTYRVTDGDNDTLERNNDRIRTYVREQGKALYDFADVEIPPARLDRWPGPPRPGPTLFSRGRAISILPVLRSVPRYRAACRVAITKSRVRHRV